jgi:hypothetical protein
VDRWCIRNVAGAVVGGQDQFATTLTPDARHVLADIGHYSHEDDPALGETEIRAPLALIKH